VKGEKTMETKTKMSILITAMIVILTIGWAVKNAAENVVEVTNDRYAKIDALLERNK
jgi:hypothetical protein